MTAETSAPASGGAGERVLIRRGGAFFRPDAAGYTTHIVAAGLYTREEAARYSDVEGVTIHEVDEYRAEAERTIAGAQRILAALHPHSTGDGERAPEWRCFHCGETFTDERCARLHFGRDEDSAPACQIKGGAEQGLLGALREAEYAAADARQAIADESTDAAKAYYAQATRHGQALRNAEELGYERGLTDGRASPPPAADAVPYLVWSNEHRAWWKPNWCGYTRAIERAGRYSREEAFAISRTRGGGWQPDENPYEIAIPEPDAVAQASARPLAESGGA